MINQQNWYIVKTESGHCDILSLENGETPDTEVYWGPFNSESDAIARRVGLIRAGKCQPRLSQP